ncbi:uncharacterized protein EI97DRAFT_457487 [Westerdykella ornata]|uniref:Uncharacterized protein n=1 Tax=Westerdykella ornata TaxID=318751 RepID=A0A6A6JML4_WESOR|nr:uncharacterized protein EI97DRAFT_457487 [Westerdykella ornata]KAF2277474.1 hypothetical protein EI97DRAFT_457487 [Westerdykella ornata]
MPGEFSITQKHPVTSEPPLSGASQKQDSKSSPSRTSSLLDAAKRKLSLSSSKDKDILPSSEEEYQKLKQKEAEKQRRKEEYEKRGLGDKVVFGSGSGMQMNG